MTDEPPDNRRVNAGKLGKPEATVAKITVEAVLPMTMIGGRIRPKADPLS